MILDLWPLTFDLPCNVNNPCEDRVIASCGDFWHSLSSGRVGYGNTRPHPLSQVGNLALSTPGLCKLPWLSKKKNWSQTDESLSTKILNIIMTCQTMTMICETKPHQSYFDNHRSCCNQSRETLEKVPQLFGQLDLACIDIIERNHLQSGFDILLQWHSTGAYRW